jgi:hypothetical protein
MMTLILTLIALLAGLALRPTLDRLVSRARPGRTVAVQSWIDTTESIHWDRVTRDAQRAGCYHADMSGEYINVSMLPTPRAVEVPRVCGYADTLASCPATMAQDMPASDSASTHNIKPNGSN